MRFILHLRDLRGEEEEKTLLGAFLEERRAHEVKGSISSKGKGKGTRVSKRGSAHQGKGRLASRG
jgi:hypothetical protein